MTDRKVIRANGVDLRVETLGAATDPAILLIGGVHRSMDWWEDEFCARLAAGMRFVIRYDHGDTGDDTGQAVTPDCPAVDLADDVVGVLDALGLPRAHLVGMSADGTLAQRVAVDHPERVASLVLIGSHGEALAREIPGVRLLALDGVGHQMPPREVWDTVIPAVLRHTSGGWDAQGDRLAARSIAAGDPTGWFDQLYTAGVAGEVPMPWDRTAPNPLLASWAADRGLAGTGRRAVVVGCGLGADAEFVAGLGYDTIAFDVAETAVHVARQRHPGSRVEYAVADLLDPPENWLRAFDLVVEVITVQALPDPVRRTAIANVGRLVAPGGTLIVVENVRADPDQAVHGPPWPLTRAEIDLFGTDQLRLVRIEKLGDPARDVTRWRAEFARPE